MPLSAYQQSVRLHSLLTADDDDKVADIFDRYPIHQKVPHVGQVGFINSTAKRKVIRAGRRGGKTTGIAIYAVEQMKLGRRILYATPTQEQVDAFWEECKSALLEPIEAKVLYKNETRHIIEVPGTKVRIRAKTAWDADSMRGDYADLLIFDEWQLSNEEAWGRVGAPMLLDNNGDAVFIYTPPSLHSRSRTKAKDPRHAAKMFKRALANKSGRWETFHFSSHDNPHISEEALEEITEDMTRLAYEQEIMALDKDSAPGALWQPDVFDPLRVSTYPDLVRVVVGVDPPGGATECGIIVAGKGSDGHGYVLDDRSIAASPNLWGRAVVEVYERWAADRVVAETNFGGDMVKSILRSVEGGGELSYKPVHASRGKAIRAEPIAAYYERGMVHHIGSFSHLEDELCNWEPGMNMKSPNRLDALVWALSALMLKKRPGFATSQANRNDRQEQEQSWRR